MRVSQWRRAEPHLAAPCPRPREGAETGSVHALRDRMHVGERLRDDAVTERESVLQFHLAILLSHADRMGKMRKVDDAGRSAVV